MQDQTFKQQFEALTLDPVYFNHLGHVRITWIYLNESTVATACEKVLDGIKKYATHLGAPDKFHYSLTVASVYIIAQAMRDSKTSNFVDFVAANADLFKHFKSQIAVYYSDKVIESNAAQQGWVEPDRQILPK
ncbi:hypothetical protein ACUR5C_00765 [Aliikangiella sp. IMCC44653]